MANSDFFIPLKLDQHLSLSLLPKPVFTNRLGVQPCGTLSIQPIKKNEDVGSDLEMKLEDASFSELFSEGSDADEEEEILELEGRKDKPYSFKRTINCWQNFVRSHMKLRDNRKLKHNINQTFFRGLKDTIKHLEVGELYDFSAKFVGLASKTRAYRAAFESFVRGIQPHVGEVYSHFCKKLRYNHPNISFCQKERMRALEIQPALRAYLHYTAFVFYDLEAKRLEEKFKVTYNGTEPTEKVWLGVKTYYGFNMLIEEVCIREADLLQVLREERLLDHFADAYKLYKTYKNYSR
mmetsp:Transcript_26598/g.47789  ORF Transcript_26598/g.47789 Transcript_26598/m.47789 type:complete len:294 (+) Transcript_26598:322-1203(+)